MTLLKLAKHLAGQHNQQAHSGGKGASSGFFQGNTKTSSVEETYKGSSREVQDLAQRTGILATDQTSLDYIKKKYDTPEMQLGGEKLPPAFKYDTMQKELRSRIGGQWTTLVERHADKSFYEMTTAKAGLLYVSSAKKGRTDYDVRNSALTSLDALADSMASRTGKHSETWKSNAPVDFDNLELPPFTDKERQIFETMSKEFTKGKGVNGASMANMIDKMPEKDLFTLHKVAHKVQAYKVVRNIATTAIDNHRYAEDQHIQKTITSLQGQRDAQSALWSTTFDQKRDLEKTIRKEIPPIKTKEKLTDYLDRVISSKRFNEIAPEIIPPPLAKKDPDFNTLMGLSTAPDSTKKAAQGRFDKSWDSVQHRGFRGKVNNAFEIIHPESVKKKWEVAKAEQGNVQTGMYHGTDYLAARGINQTGFRVSKGDVKAGRMLGDGVYIADKSSKSMQYIGSKFSRAAEDGVMFENDVAMDTIKDWSKPENSNWPNRFERGEFNSMYAPKDKRGITMNGTSSGTIRNDEWSVRDPGGVLPTLWMDVTKEN